MAITNYTNLQTAVEDWLNRADLAQKIPDFITLAEATLNKVLRHSRMVTTDTLSLGANSQRVAVPSDMLEPIYLQVTSDPDFPLEQVSPQQLIMLRRARLRDPGNPRFFAIIGRFIEVAPVPSAGVSLDLMHYEEIPPLSGGNPTNWVLQYNPDLYLYTALLHAAPFLQDDARSAVLDNMVTKQVMAAVTQNRTATFDNVRAPGFSLDSPSDGMRPPSTSGGGPAPGV
jgi:hypothetical protein